MFLIVPRHPPLRIISGWEVWGVSFDKRGSGSAVIAVSSEIEEGVEVEVEGFGKGE